MEYIGCVSGLDLSYWKTWQTKKSTTSYAAVSINLWDSCARRT